MPALVITLFVGKNDEWMFDQTESNHNVGNWSSRKGRKTRERGAEEEQERCQQPQNRNWDSVRDVSAALDGSEAGILFSLWLLPWRGYFISCFFPSSQKGKKKKNKWQKKFPLAFLFGFLMTQIGLQRATSLYRNGIKCSLSQLLVGLVSSYRYDEEAVDLVTADSEASSLHEAIQTKKLDEDHVLWIICTRNVHQLRATFECYKKKYGNTIDKVSPQRICSFISCLIFILF